MVEQEQAEGDEREDHEQHDERAEQDVAGGYENRGSELRRCEEPSDLMQERRLRPLGVPAAAVRSLPEALEATPEVVVTAGDFRLVGNPIRVSGYQPEYRPPPEL